MDQNLGILIAEIGFPITAALGVGAAIWGIVRWMMTGLHRDIAEIQTRLDVTQREQTEILVKLIDRVRRLEDSITRTEIIVRTAWNLEQSWDRVGRAPD